MATKRNYKDSVFRDIFNNKRRLSRLYKALTGRDIPPKEIRITTLRGTFMNDIKNDISFSAGGHLVVLLEHQSTWNPNMPFRFLEYVAKVYTKIVDSDIIYRSKLAPIPSPEFYVFYNGVEEQPYEQELRLSDAFPIQTGALELVAKCYNINLAENNELLDACYELKAYSVFVQKVREGKAQGLSPYQSIRDAILYCESHDWMKGYFASHESEVFNMVSFKWNDAKALRIAKEEYFERGEAKGIKKGLIQAVVGLLQNNAPLSLITASTNLTPAEVEQIAKENGLALSL